MPFCNLFMGRPSYINIGATCRTASAKFCFDTFVHCTFCNMYSAKLKVLKFVKRKFCVVCSFFLLILGLWARCLHLFPASQQYNLVLSIGGDVMW